MKRMTMKLWKGGEKLHPLQQVVYCPNQFGEVASLPEWAVCLSERGCFTILVLSVKAIIQNERLL